MLGFTLISEHTVKCDTCGKELPTGIIGISSHWAECAGKAQMDFVNKVAKSNLAVKDKMDLIKKEFNIEQ